MLNEDLQVYDSCNLKSIAIPPRSRLYSLEPIGINTPYVESLTSYISRLAEAHCLTPNSLITRIIAPELKFSFIKHSSSRDIGTFFKKSGFINGYGEISSEFTRLLSNLTKVNNLALLTLGRYSSIFPSRKLLKKNKCWCPVCFEEWMLSGKILYEPLLWSLADTSICHFHHQCLQDKCPNCHKLMPWLKGRIRVGYCPNCESWLGKSISLSSKLNYLEFKKQLWNNEKLGELLLCDKVFANNVCEIIHEIIQVLFDDNISAFAKKLGFSKNTVWSWYHNQNMPELRSFLKICYSLNLSPVDFINGKQIVSRSIKVDSTKLIKPKGKKRKSPKSLDRKNIEKELLKILEDQKKPFLPMREVAKDLDISLRTLYRNFPLQCKAISARYRSYQKEAKDLQIDRCCLEIELAITKIYQSGEYPTEARVSKLIKQPGYLRYPKVRATLNQFLLKYISI